MSGWVDRINYCWGSQDNFQETRSILFTFAFPLFGFAFFRHENCSKFRAWEDAVDLRDFPFGMFIYNTRYIVHSPSPELVVVLVNCSRKTVSSVECVAMCGFSALAASGLVMKSHIRWLVGSIPTELYETTALVDVNRMED